jgi:[CysO sulfur-carrier protein]-S-L-cysteine hydrolase
MADLFFLEKKYADEMIAHAHREVPNECCGIMAGVNNKVVKFYQTINTERNPARYRIDSQQMFAIYKEIRENGWEISGIYHSHVQTAAYPSPADTKNAVLSGPVYLIVSLQNPEQAVIKGFRILEGNITEIELRLIDS